MNGWLEIDLNLSKTVLLMRHCLEGFIKDCKLMSVEVHVVDLQNDDPLYVLDLI